jgi:translation initiation factor 1
MAKTDWKNTLGTLVRESSVEDTTNTAKPTKKQDLIIRFEKRNGKPATIVSNYDGTEAELKELATALKKHCGVGGSAKDDELLIQGDVRSKVADYLRQKGFRVKGDFKK